MGRAPSQHDEGPSRDDASTLRDDDDPVSPEASFVNVRYAERYLRSDRLGVGAMGEVHLCHDAVIGRDVAMKTPLAESAGDTRLHARFVREAQIQGRLEHPAIVPVHDLGIAPDGTPYFTMKRVQGTSLRAVLNGLRRGDPTFIERYGLRRLLTAFSTVCVAVAFAHARGILHRDIKPSNVMLGDFGEVYLLDWGVAKLDVARLGEFAQVTTGELTGTVGYMAPEQVRGDPLDERADVYALGAVLFEILALEPLHPRNVAAALACTVRGVDARPSVRAPARKVPPELEALCVGATALDPAERIPSARALHEAVERYLDGDRDVERRRTLAAVHAGRARADMVHVLRSGSPEARQRAYDEANRALALDPQNDVATQVMGALILLTEPTGEVDEALRASVSRARRMVARTGFALFVPWVLGVASIALLGVRDVAWYVGTLVCTVVAGALVWWRTQREHPWITIAALVACDVATILVAYATNPFVVAPGLLASFGVAFTIASKERGDTTEARCLRHLTIALGVASFLVPIVLELLGVLPPSARFEGGAIVLLPRAVGFPQGPTLTLLVLVNALLVVIPALFAIRVRDHASAVERRAFEALSRYRQLLPPHARDAGADAATQSHSG